MAAKVTPIREGITRLWDGDAEASVLGAILLRNRAIAEVDLEPADFYDPRHKAVWESIVRIDAKGEPIDDVTLRSELERSDKLDAVGGLPFISELALRVPTAENIRHYAKVLRDRRRARDVYLLGGKLQSLAAAGEESEELVAEAHRQLEELALGGPSPARRAHDIIDDILEDAAKPMIKSGFPLLDTRIGGFRVNTVTTLIGPTGGGKTSWTLQVGAAVSARHPVIYVGLELTQSQLVARVVGQRLGKSWSDVLSGDFDLREAKRSLELAELWLIDRQPNVFAAIERQLDDCERRMPGRMALLVIDYVQLLATDDAELRSATRSAALQILRLTEKRNVTTLVLSQTSRANSTKMREGGGAAQEYVGTGLESGSIEHSSAIELVIEMPAEDDVEEREGAILVAKNRYGSEGAVGFAYHGATGVWRELAQRPPSAAERKAAKQDGEDDAAVLAAVQRRPGAAWREVRDMVGVSRARVDRSKARLLRSGALEVRDVDYENARGQARKRAGFFIAQDEERE